MSVHKEKEKCVRSHWDNKFSLISVVFFFVFFFFFVSVFEDSSNLSAYNNYIANTFAPLSGALLPAGRGAKVQKCMRNEQSIQIQSKQTN